MWREPSFCWSLPRSWRMLSPPGYIVRACGAAFSGYSPRLPDCSGRDRYAALLHCAHDRRSNHLAFRLPGSTAHARDEWSSLGIGTDPEFAWYLTRPDCLGPVSDHQPGRRACGKYCAAADGSGWRCSGYYPGGCHERLSPDRWKAHSEWVTPQYATAEAREDTLSARYPATGGRRVHSRPT